MSSQANAKISPVVAQAVAGDRDAFAALYNDHHVVVSRYLYSRTKDSLLAEDLTQETFLRALRRIDTFQHMPTTAGFLGWLFVIAKNLHLDHLKLYRTRCETPVAEPLGDYRRDHSAGAEESAFREMAIVEARESVTAAMNQLTPYQRQVIELRFFEELSGPETAARLGKRLGAVKTAQFRAMSVMEQALTEGAAA
ncbi:RNA polymerase sigma factor [Streptomyces sp. NPDC093223]|uniref:RNA polymerase sigma factor n=1 Tax=Streptomyces sp. NPDC093223 TaxID=3366033 RepID=UPI00380B09FF